MRLKLIICCRTDGLGVRFNNYMYAKSVANYLKIPCLMLWTTVGKAAQCSFKELYETDSPDFLDIASKKFKHERQLITTHILKHYNIDITQKDIKAYKDRDVKLITNKILEQYDILYHIGNHSLKLEKPAILNPPLTLRQTLNKLKLNSYITEQLALYDNLYNHHNVIGFHIRRGDCVDRPPGTKNYNKGNVSLKQFYNIIDTKYYNKNKYIFFVASDDNNVTQEFIKTYKYNIKTHDKKTISKTFCYQCRSQDRGSTIAIQDAIITMMLFSKCSVIYGSRSAFSETAANINAIPKYTIDMTPNDKIKSHIKELTSKANSQTDKY